MKEPVYIFSSGALERHENTLRFTSEKGRRFIPVETTSEIHVFGELDLNARLLNFLTRHGIPLHVHNYYGYYAGSYMPREQYVSGHVTLRQAAHYLDPDLHPAAFDSSPSRGCLRPSRRASPCPRSSGSTRKGGG